MGVKKLWWSFSSVGKGWPDSLLQIISMLLTASVLIGTVAAKKSYRVYVVISGSSQGDNLQQELVVIVLPSLESNSRV